MTLQEHFRRVCLLLTFILAVVVVVLLTSCGGVRPRVPMVRTTTVHPGAFGASATTTTVDTPFESPAYAAGVGQLFHR